MVKICGIPIATPPKDGIMILHYNLRLSECNYLGDFFEGPNSLHKKGLSHWIGVRKLFCSHECFKQSIEL